MTAQDSKSKTRSFRNHPIRRYGIRETQSGAADRLAFPAQSSVLDERAIRERVICLYDLPPIISCRFLARGDSDVYAVVAADHRRFYLKAYRPPRSLAAAEAEGQLTADLSVRGFPAAVPVPRRDGRYATAVDANEGIRPVLVWNEALGTRPGLELPVVEAIGGTIGQLHNICDGLEGNYELIANDVETVIELLPYAMEFMGPADGELAAAAAEWGRERIGTWPREAPGFGICHGDLASVNIRSHPERGITLFDFGACGYTWRVCDLLRFHAGPGRSPERQARWDAFQTGYSAVRALPTGMSEMLPVFSLMSHLGWMSRCAGACQLRMGTESPEERMPHDIQSLREHVHAIPELSEYLRTQALI